jgi:hypothetical protein
MKLITVTITLLAIIFSGIGAIAGLYSGLWMGAATVAGGIVIWLLLHRASKDSILFG